MKPRRAIIVFLSISLLVAGCGPGSGDRVLVAKYIYDTDVTSPERHDIVVFRFPQSPIEDGIPTNYIKRLLGLARETLAIFFGQLFVFDGDFFPNKYKSDLDPNRVPPNELWRWQYMHVNDSDALQFFKEGKFRIIRKSPAVMLALSRIVFDNDHQAKSLQGVLPPRWAPANENGWKADNKNGFVSAGSEHLEWLHYRHILPPNGWKMTDAETLRSQDHKPQLITDFSGYNSAETRPPEREQSLNWVGDLMLEAQITVDRSEGELWLELSKGIDRFQARFDLKSGMCSLVRIHQSGEKKEEILESKKTTLSAPGTYHVRFANYDERLTVWVNQELPFGDGVEYTRSWKYDESSDRFLNVGPTINDLQPASIGSKLAAVSVRQLKLWRDTYYTYIEHPDVARVPQITSEPTEQARILSDPAQWHILRDLPCQTMFVQPGHYLCLGDNSPASSDSRMWGVVPQRLMLGRALAVYFPFGRAQIIR